MKYNRRVKKYKYQCSEKTKHRLRLLHIARKLTREDVECLRLVVGDIIPRKTARDIQSGLSLFQHLKWRGASVLNDYDQLRKLLLHIGRRDLANKLPTGKSKSDCVEVSYRDEFIETHRFLLLKVSEQLFYGDVQKLLFLCPSIREASRPEIKEGYKLFYELEKQELLGPKKYGYLLERLKCIGRNDLAEFMVTETGIIPEIPDSFRVPNQSLECVFHSKQLQYKSFRNELSRLTSNCHTWEVMVKAAWEDMKPVYAMSTPAVYQWQSLLDHESEIDQMITLSLQSICAFTEGFHTRLRIVADSDSFDVDMIRPWVDKCLDSSAQFNKALMPTQWNTVFRKRIQQLHDERKDPVGVPAQNACKSITDICKGLMDGDCLDSITASVGRKLFTIESISYSAWAYMLMLQWLAMLVHMARHSKLDLAKYSGSIMSVVLVHKDHIFQSYEMLVDILGKEVMKIVDPLLQDTLASVFPGSPHNPNSYNHPNTILAAFYTFIISLFAQSHGYSIDSAEVGRRLIEVLYEQDSYSCQIHSCVRAARKMAHATSTEVENLKKAVERSCSSFAQRVIVEKLLDS